MKLANFTDIYETVLIMQIMDSVACLVVVCCMSCGGMSHVFW